MQIKIDSKTLLKFGSVFAGGIALGAVGGIKLYKERKVFREWIDNKVFPGLKDFINNYGITLYRVLIVTLFENNSKARAMFLLAGDVIENGDKKTSKQIEREFFKHKEKLPEMMELIEKKAKENE